MKENNSKNLTFEEIKDINDLREDFFNMGEDLLLSEVSGEISEDKHYVYFLENNKKIGVYHYLYDKNDKTKDGFFVGINTFSQVDNIHEYVLESIYDCEKRFLSLGIKQFSLTSRLPEVVNALDNNDSFKVVEATLQKELNSKSDVDEGYEFKEIKNISDLREKLFSDGNSEALAIVSGDIEEFRHFVSLSFDNSEIGFCEYHHLKSREDSMFANLILYDENNDDEKLVDIFKNSISFVMNNMLLNKCKTLTVTSAHEKILKLLTNEMGFKKITATFVNELKS